MSEMREKMKLKRWKIHSQGRLKDSTLHNFPDSVHRNIHKYLLKLYTALPFQRGTEGKNNNKRLSYNPLGKLQKPLYALIWTPEDMTFIKNLHFPLMSDQHSGSTAAGTFSPRRIWYMRNCTWSSVSFWHFTMLFRSAPIRCVTKYLWTKGNRLWSNLFSMIRIKIPYEAPLAGLAVPGMLLNEIQSWHTTWCSRLVHQFLQRWSIKQVNKLEEWNGIGCPNVFCVVFHNCLRIMADKLRWQQFL